MADMDIEIVGDRLGARTGYAARSVLKEVPGALWSAVARCWTYPLAYPSALALGEAAKRLGETITPTAEAAEWVQAEMKAWGVLSAESARLVPETEAVEGFFPHQVQCARWLSLPGAKGGRLDTSQTGSGKTRASLRAAWECWSQGETGILLVSTLMAVKHGWRSEVAAVSGLLPLPGGQKWQVFSLPNGAAIGKRRTILAEAAAASEAAGGVGVVLLTNHEQLRTHSRLSGYGDIALRRCPKCGGVRAGEDVVTEAKCQAHDKELNKLDYVAVVYDECHRMMEPKAQLTRAAWAIADRAPRTWGLTGTPGSRSVMENTWALQRLVYGKGWPSKSSWTKYFAECGYSSLGFWEVGRLRAERSEEFQKTYSSLSRRVLKDQVLDLPPLLRGGTLERFIPMTGEQLTAYNTMRDELWLKVAEGEVTAANMLVQVGRLTMLANATGIPGPDYGKLLGYKLNAEGQSVPVYNAEMKLRMPSNKVTALVDMIASGDLDEGAVFQFVHPDLLYMLRNALVEKKVISRAEEFGVIAGDVSEAQRGMAIDRFQSGKMRYIAFTVAAGGAGITLTRAPVMVAVERPWSPIQWAQAQDRVHRIGSEIHDKVSIIDLITDNSVELRQMERFRDNSLNLEDVVRDKDRVKELLFG